MLSDSSSTNLAGRLCCLAVKFQGQVHLTSQAVKICQCQYLSVNGASRAFVKPLIYKRMFLQTFVPKGLAEQKKQRTTSGVGELVKTIIDNPRHHFVNSTLKLVKRHDPRGIRVAGEGKTTQELEDAKAEWPLEIMEGKSRCPQL